MLFQRALEIKLFCGLTSVRCALSGYIEGGDRGGRSVVPGTMVVNPFGTTWEEAIGAERREKSFQVVPNSLRWYHFYGGPGHAAPEKI